MSHAGQLITDEYQADNGLQRCYPGRRYAVRTPYIFRSRLLTYCRASHSPSTNSLLFLTFSLIWRPL